MIVNRELPACPVATAISLIGNKWKLLIIRNLLNSPQRYTQLLKGIDCISKKVLTENLRALEMDGIITRTVHKVTSPKIVEYSISEFGQTLSPVFDILTKWGFSYKKHIAENEK